MFFYPKYFAGCPEFGKTHFRKTCLPLLGTSMPPVWREIFYRMSRFGQNSFPENMFAPFGDINAPVSMKM